MSCGSRVNLDRNLETGPCEIAMRRDIKAEENKRRFLEQACIARRHDLTNRIRRNQIKHNLPIPQGKKHAKRRDRSRQTEAYENGASSGKGHDTCVPRTDTAQRNEEKEAEEEVGEKTEKEVERHYPERRKEKGLTP